MEIALLIALFVYLIVTNSNFSAKLNRLEDQLSSINQKINSLKNSELTEKKSVEPIIPEVEIKPIPSVVEPTVKEETTQVVEIPDLNPIFEEKENVVFSMDTLSQPKPATKPYVEEKSWWENFKEKNPDLEKFIGENLINKIGVLILVLGISYFVKYSIDKGWISEPARVGIGILSGALVMGIAHKLRQKYAAFSSVFVAGAIAIFYFTIGIAFHDYKLFGQTTAFIIMVIITAFSGLISLSYNRKELAVLSLIGGFAVPFMVSTGQGNYIALFTYIIILDLGILAIAYFKKWNIINILSYLFTIILFGAWLFKDLEEKQPHYFGALLFGFAFYFIFILINIINNLRTKGIFTTIELSILASNTFLFYGAGMMIFEHFHPELKGIFTTILGLLNLVYAWFLYKKFGLDKTAVYLLIGLTLTFITLAIPIQFKGNYITLFWSAEAVLLFWLSQKSKIVSYKFGSVIVTILMLVSLIMDWNSMYSYDAKLVLFLNKICITGLFSIGSLVALSFLLQKETENSEQFGITLNPFEYQKFIAVVGIIISYLVGFLEVSFQSKKHIVGSDSAFSLVLFYHLSFCAILFFFLNKNKELFRQKIGVFIGIINIILFTFWFSNYSFYEHTEYITTGVHQRIAFILHYFSVAIVIYFGYTIFKINKETALFSFLNSKFIPWIVAFFIVYLASTELMLHSLVISNSPINSLKNQDDTFSKSYLLIENTRSQVIKTGFPILWGLLAFIFLIFGIKKQNKPLRIIALSLLGLTIVKLFLFDIKNASETGKIVAFILLGVLILIISFVYQKIKVLVLDNNKPKEQNETE